MKVMKNKIQERVARVIENAEILDKRAYLTVDAEGVIKRKDMNLTIPAMVFCQNDEVFNMTLEKECNKVEREKEKKIERLSNLSVDKLKENLVKLVVKGEIEFSKRYAKELALRDKEEFLKTLFNLALMDNPSSMKALMALSMKEILNTLGWIDELGYLVISYFTKQRYDLHLLENVEEKEALETIQEDSLALVAYKKVLESYEYTNAKKYIGVLNESSRKIKFKNYSEVEKEILKSIKL